jgi:hypothetical protein
MPELHKFVVITVTQLPSYPSRRKPPPPNIGNLRTHVHYLLQGCEALVIALAGEPGYEVAVRPWREL